MDREPGHGNFGVCRVQPQSRTELARKAACIEGSSAVASGDHSRYNPEELLVGALSACQTPRVLHLCADAGIVITEYTDDALGEMAEHAGGAGEFTRVVLSRV